MASKTTLNAKNLEALGAEHLALLLMDISEGNANAKRRLRFELAGSESPDKLAGEIRKRLTAIGASTANIGWRTLKGFRGDLNTQRRLILDQVLKVSPGDAEALIWQFIDLGEAVIERSSDMSGGVVEVFKAACDDLAEIMVASAPTREVWLPRAITALMDNSYGQNDGLIESLIPSLSSKDLEQLRTQLLEFAKAPAISAPAKARPVKRWRKRALAKSETLRKRSRSDCLQVALLALADALGDVDAYITLMKDAYIPSTAAEIALRLLKAGRPSEALKALDSARGLSRTTPPEAWVDARIAALEALNQGEMAQTLRLDRFHATLSAPHLRAFLKRLPDFDDIEAEDEALDWAKGFPDANASLGLLVAWPSLERAADLVVRRLNELDGLKAEGLTLTADRLSSRYPLAALLLHRHMVEASLAGYNEAAHAQAASSYLEAESLARHIEIFEPFDTHVAWRTGLGTTYARRTAFWKALP